MGARRASARTRRRWIRRPGGEVRDGGVHGGKDHGHGHWGHHGSDNHRSSSSCDNSVGQFGAGNGGGFVDVLGGAQTAVPVNACHILDDNNIVNHVDLDVLSGGSTTQTPTPTGASVPIGGWPGFAGARRRVWPGGSCGIQPP